MELLRMGDKEMPLQDFTAPKHVVDTVDNTELSLKFSVGSFRVQRVQNNFHKDFSGIKMALNNFISS